MALHCLQRCPKSYQPEAPAFDYVPLLVYNGVAYLAGQLAKENGVIRHQGRAGIEVSESEAARQMSLCALQALARLKAHFGTLERVQQVLHLNAYVACHHDFTQISTLADHASRIFITAYGDPGRHPRSVLGVTRLPQHAPVMIDVRVAISD